MKITIYELLGMIKDGNAPKRIKYGNVIYKKMNIDNYEAEDFNIKLFDYNFFQESRLNDTVEILEEEKKIPEKLSTKTPFDDKEKEVFILENRVKINEIIDCLDYLKSKGDE